MSPEEMYLRHLEKLSIEVIDFIEKKKLTTTTTMHLIAFLFATAAKTTGRPDWKEGACQDLELFFNLIEVRDGKSNSESSDANSGCSDSNTEEGEIQTTRAVRHIQPASS